MATGRAFDGKPYAGNPHAWPDDGAGGPRHSGRSVVAALAVFWCTTMMTAPLYAAGAVFTLKTGLTDNPTRWQSGESYDEGTAPEAGDIVVIPDNTTAYVDDDTIAFVGSLQRLETTNSNNSVVHFNITTNATANCAINHQGVGLHKGKIVKDGAGTLLLSAQNGDCGGSSGKNNYYSAITIVNGGLQLSAPASSLNLQDVVVEENGTFYMDNGKSFTVMSISGAGTIRNDDGAYKSLIVGSEACYKADTPYVFSGKILGKIYIDNRVNTHYTNEENTFYKMKVNNQTKNLTLARNLEVGAIMGAKKIGKLNQPSSIGTNMVNLGATVRLRYLGDGETTDKPFSIEGTAGPVMIDGGAHGDITFNGTWGLSETNLMRHLIIAGDAGECVLDNNLSGYSKSSTNYAAYITKRGAGSWYFKAGHTRSLADGVIAVENGTVKYDSMVRAGKRCSFGTGRELFKPIVGRQAESNRVDYAFLLGSGSSAAPTNGTLAYAGSTNFWMNTRKIVIKTAGTLTSESTGAVKWRGIEVGGDVGPKSLTLAGNGSSTNYIYDLADGVDRPLSVIKDGTGNWTLSGDLTFSGGLEVRGGTLNIISAPIGTPYSYFRFTAKENAYNCERLRPLPTYVSSDKTYYQLQEFALYDEDGIRQNVFRPSATNVMFSVLEPGQAAYDDEKFVNPGANGRFLCRLFDDTTGGSGGIPGGGWDVTVSPNVPSLMNTNSWVSIVIRLTNSTPTIASYDLCCYLGTNSTSNPGRGITAYTLDGGVDGVHWELVDENLAADVPAGSSKWYFDKSSYSSNSGNTPRTGFTFGRLGTVTNAFSTLANVPAISIMSGGVLRATQPVPLREGVTLTLDAENGGALEGFTLPARGTLSVVGAPNATSLVLPATFDGSDGLGNVSGWALTINGGDATTRYAVGVKGGRITLTRRGTTIVVR